MAACSFDMQFTYVCAGWEGTTHDTRIFNSVLNNPDRKFPKPLTRACRGHESKTIYKPEI